LRIDSLPFALLFEAAKAAEVEIVGAGGVVRDAESEVSEKAVKLGGGGVVHGLGEVVLGGVGNAERGTGARPCTPWSL
jgi:hypothetical protein